MVPQTLYRQLWETNQKRRVLSLVLNVRRKEINLHDFSGRS